MIWSKKPSHATVLLKVLASHSNWWIGVGSFQRYWEKGEMPSLTVVLNNNGIYPQETTKIIFSVLKVTEMALSNQSDFMQFLVSGKSSYNEYLV